VWRQLTGNAAASFGFPGASKRSSELAERAVCDGEFIIEMPIAQSRSLPQENAGAVHYQEPLSIRAPVQQSNDPRYTVSDIA
jgi:hypothetical protein